MEWLARSAHPMRGRTDSAHMRARNMGLILRHLRASGGRSRAKLALETGLAKATVSSLVGDLTELGLVRDSGTRRDGTVGRPGLIVELDGQRICGVGVEINTDYVALVAADLTRRVILETTQPMAVDKLTPGEVLDHVSELLVECLTTLRAEGRLVASLTVSPPGVIDYEEGSVRFAPNIGWRSVPIVSEIRHRLGAAAPDVRLENDAKLSALAEYANYEAKGVRDLLFVTGDIGVGVGIVADGRLVRGWSGFSGEVGHLPLDPKNRPCSCGRTGCWERAVGLEAFLALAVPNDDALNDPEQPLETRLAEIRARADQGDQRTIDAVTEITGHLARGLGILIDVLNPKAIILGGYFTFLADHIIPQLTEMLQHRRMDEGSAVDLAPSTLGIVSAAYGGAIVSTEHVFIDPTVIPVV